METPGQLRTASLRARARRSVRLRGERGFTMIEVMVAGLLLAIGVLGVIGLMDGANIAIGQNRDREAATSLAREVTEDVDSLAYSQIDPTTLTGTLQSKPGLASTGSGWTVSRRGVTYTIAVSVCNVDDPRDGTGAHDSSFCPGGAAAGTSDTQPIDYKRVTTTVSWHSITPGASIQQSTLKFPGSGGNVPAVTNLVGSPTQPITSSATTSVGFTATTSAAPAGVEWFVNDNPQGVATGSGTSWTFNWSLANVPDGTYVISARAYNAAGDYGSAYEVTYSLNRSAAAAPSGFAAGWNAQIGSVDAEWLASTEGDVVGYHVYRQETSPTAGSATQVNCGTTSNPVYLVTGTTCTDASALPQPVPAVTVGNSSATAINGVSFFTLTKPSGVVAGDLMVATVDVQGSVTITAPSGWTQIQTGTTSNNKETETTFYRVATSTSPNTYTFTLSKKNDASGGITDYSGVDTTNPIDASGESDNTSGSAIGPALTTTQANDQVIEATGFTGLTSGWSPTPPSGMTSRISASASNTSTLVADTQQASAGWTGWPFTNPNQSDAGWVAQTIALKPAGTTLAVNYWVVACDYDTSGNLREGAASTSVNAYSANTAPYPPTWGTTPLTNQSDGTTLLQWNASPGDPDTGDYVDFYRIYRDGQRYDTAGTSSTQYVDKNPGGTTHTYQITAVDSHMAESTMTSGVTG